MTARRFLRTPGLLHLFRGGMDTATIAENMNVGEAFIYNTLWGQRQQEFSNRASLQARDTAAGVPPPLSPPPPKHPRPALSDGTTAAVAYQGDMPQAQKSVSARTLSEGGMAKAKYIATANVPEPSLIRGVT